MSNISKFKALPGFIIAIPHIVKETFNSSKLTAGDCQKSEVIAVGDKYVNDYGKAFDAPVKVGDIVLHRYTSDSWEENSQEYRVVHFNNIFGKK
jgi:co-chaperonin GroES (HSP10)